MTEQIIKTDDIKAKLTKALNNNFLQNYTSSDIESQLARVLCFVIPEQVISATVAFSMPGLSNKSIPYITKKVEQLYPNKHQLETSIDKIFEYFAKSNQLANNASKSDASTHMLGSAQSIYFKWYVTESIVDSKLSVLNCILTSDPSNQSPRLTACWQLQIYDENNAVEIANQLKDKLNTDIEITYLIWRAYKARKWPEMAPAIRTYTLSKYNSSVPWPITKFKSLNKKLKVWADMDFPVEYWADISIPILLTVWRQLLLERFFTKGADICLKEHRDTLKQTVDLISSVSTEEHDGKKLKRYKNLVGLFAAFFTNHEDENENKHLDSKLQNVDKHIKPLAMWLQVRLGKRDVSSTQALLATTYDGLNIYLKHLGLLQAREKTPLKRGYLMLWLVFQVLEKIKDKKDYQFIEPEKCALAFVITESARTIFSDGYRFRSFPVDLAMSMLRLIKMHCRENLELYLPISLFRTLENSLHASQSSETLNFALQHCQHIIDVYIFGQYMLSNKGKIADNLQKTFAISALFHDLGMLENGDSSTEMNWQKVHDEFAQIGLIESRELESLSHFETLPLQKQGISSAYILIEHVHDHNQIQSDERKKLVIRDLIKPAARAILFHNMSYLPDRYTRDSEKTAMMLLLCDLVLPWHPSSTLIENPKAIQAEGLLCHFHSTANTLNGDLATEYQYENTHWIKLTATENLPTLLQVLRLIQSGGKLHLENITDKYKNSPQLLFKVPNRKQLLHSMQMLSDSFYHQMNVNIRDWIGQQKSFWSDLHTNHCSETTTPYSNDKIVEGELSPSESLYRMIQDGQVHESELSQLIWIETGTAPLGYFDVMAYAALPEVKAFLKRYRPF
ncbi:hypothetical protein [Pseudoalteromonas obscura]|uniref:HD domain-containing protein n=1 Tax=Pseudoalteromonas obscura TaxID=3048491 RepID=A0ABT7EDW9_9GAMM|nr:hypothetical protein [Pseudoalteromonas sp. P94(2023)]MDK2593467.1 hypothetical protein [Pseudoalteromonas sp. P94(2023)]